MTVLATAIVIVNCTYRFVLDEGVAILDEDISLKGGNQKY